MKKMIVVMSIMLASSSVATPQLRLDESIYNSQQAKVRTGSELNLDEINFLQVRRPYVKKNLEKLLNMKLRDDQVPTIALCTSGGSYRAMLSTLGTIQGMKPSSYPVPSKTFSTTVAYYSTILWNWLHPYQEPDDSIIAPTQ